MKTIHIDGVIGWDVTASDIRDKFKNANGEIVDLAISSPGGSVYEGLAIFNAIRDYRKQGGIVNARVIGMAASMATYIPLAANSVSIEDNAIWMIHNPWSYAVGNQHDMRKEAEILDGITSVLSSTYIKKTGKEKDEILSMMDDETYLFGQDIVDQGFADSVEPAGDGAEDQESALAFAKTNIQAMNCKMSQEPEKQQMKKAVALIKEINNQEINPVVSRVKTATAETEKEIKMTLEELKKAHSAVYSEAVAVGIKTERERRNALSAIAKADPENENLSAVVAEAIEQGTMATDLAFNTKVNVAIRDGKAEDGENPPKVETVSNVVSKNGLDADSQVQADAALKLIRGLK